MIAETMAYRASRLRVRWAMVPKRSSSMTSGRPTARKNSRHCRSVSTIMQRKPSRVWNGRRMDA
ncbi:Uncharacterised protein [Bordetella pertussis]|nr:Uncharacterised protein [Bordetella pertussis]